MSTPVASPQPGQKPSRSAQVALAVIGTVMVGLLAFRGYGHRLAARPTEHHPAVTRHVDLNAADRAELLQVPGVGPALADAILTHRRDHGRFAAVDDLNAVHGIGDRTLEKIRPWVTVPAPDGPATVEPAVERLERKPVTPPPAPTRSGKLRPGDPPLDVNAASEEELQRLPGVGPVIARKIVDARAVKPFEAPDDLRRVKGIGPKTMETLRPLVVCR